MLAHLHVKNLALIEEIEVEFGPGLNILTGETGASNARQSDERTASGSKVYCGCSKIASTCWGVFNKLARERSSCETSTSSLASISGCS